jgi:thiamine biosynthesis lipoprotein
LKVKGNNPDGAAWQIGIDRPSGENLQRELNAIISLTDAAMATSGNYRKFYEKEGKRFSHTLDPETGYPAEQQLLSATVIADKCYKADALATAFMVMGLEKTKQFLKENKKFQAYLIYAGEGEKFEVFSTEGMKEKKKNTLALSKLNLPIFLTSQLS